MNPTNLVRASVAALVVAWALAACTSIAPITAPARPSMATQPAVNCPALASQALPGTRITEALFVGAGTQRAREPSGREVGEPLPEHCIVRGRIDERTGQDGKPYHTGFELRLPSAWNGRFMYQGGGGNDGMISTRSAATPARLAGPTTAWRAALRR